MASHAQSGPQDPHARLVARLREDLETIRRLTSGLDESTLAKRPPSGKWSMKELVCHLWRVQQVFEGRIEAMLTQTEPVVARYDPDADAAFDQMVAGRTAQAAVDGFTAERARLVKRLEGLSPAEWHRRGWHPEYPDYDVHFQVEYMAYHEEHHIYQMLHLRAPLGKLPH